jgi:hypothetical protein
LLAELRTSRTLKITLQNVRYTCLTAPLDRRRNTRCRFHRSMPTITKGRAAVKTRLLVLLAGAFMALPIARCFADSPHYEAHCKEPLPVFTIGENSNPTKDQESALCACIWNSLEQSDRVTSENIRQSKESQVSASELQDFIRSFRDALEKCGGMKL